LWPSLRVVASETSRKGGGGEALRPRWAVGELPRRARISRGGSQRIISSSSFTEVGSDLGNGHEQPFAFEDARRVILNSFMRHDHAHHSGGKTAENSVCS
jgi:hypothetical protein